MTTAAAASPTWNTKYGPRRVKLAPPTLAEAVAAAKDMAPTPRARSKSQPP